MCCGSFSAWHKEQGGDLNERAYIARFAQTRFRIVTGHTYPARIPRRLERSLAGVLTGDGVVLVPTTEARNRLVYALQIRLGQNTEEVVDYWTRDHIKDYYQDVTDFDLQDSNVILFGPEMVLSWIQSRLPHYVLHDRVQFAPCDDDELEAEDEKDAEQGERKSDDDEERMECRAQEAQGFVIDPYFLRLEALDGRVYLVQQARSLAHALYLSETWLARGYNPGYGSEGVMSTTTPFRYIAYDGPLNMTVENINGAGGRHTVLQYRFKNEIWTMALLPYGSEASSAI